MREIQELQQAGNRGEEPLLVPGLQLDAVGLGLDPGAPFSRCLDDERCFVYGGAPGALSLSRYSRPAARPWLTTPPCPQGSALLQDKMRSSTS